MGRYTSVQSFSDQNTKVVSGYKHEGGEQGSNRQGARPPAPEKVENVMGSCAGAGSGEFDLYRAARRRELTRLDQIEKKERSEVEAEIYAAKVARNKRECEERTTKNAEARKKKKMKKLMAKTKAGDDEKVAKLSSDIGEEDHSEEDLEDSGLGRPAKKIHRQEAVKATEATTDK